jgi:hypothetical protein
LCEEGKSEGIFWDRKARFAFREKDAEIDDAYLSGLGAVCRGDTVSRVGAVGEGVSVVVESVGALFWRRDFTGFLSAGPRARAPGQAEAGAQDQEERARHDRSARRG